MGSWEDIILLPLQEQGFDYFKLLDTDIFELFNLSNALYRKRELEACNYWYQSTESKIYSEARERPKNCKPDFEYSESEIKTREANLRKKYYRDTIPKNEVDDKNLGGGIPTLENYHNGLAQIKNIMRKGKEQI